MKNKRQFDVERLEHILKSINFILANCRGIDFDYFLDQEFLKRAVVKELEIIGEASNYLSEELRAKYDTIEWRKIVGLRNRLIHKYYDIN